MPKSQKKLWILCQKIKLIYMLHYRNREKSVQIITLNPTFASEVSDRLRNFPGLESVKLLLPGKAESDFKIEEIERQAHDTTTSAILIFDVCSWSKIILQQAFSDIIRFNRPDFNEFCYSIVVGDLPIEYIKKGKLNNIHNYLSDIRVDFSPAVFFVNPLSLYSQQEKQAIMATQNNPFPEKIPQLFGKYFDEKELPSIRKVWAFFRAAEAEDDKKLKAKSKRLEILKSLYIKMIEEDFPSLKEMFLSGLTKEGYAVPGESLKVNLYPFFFEEFVLELMNKIES